MNSAEDPNLSSLYESAIDDEDHAIIEESVDLTLDASHMRTDDLSESGFNTESSQVIRTPRDDPSESSQSDSEPADASENLTSGTPNEEESKSKIDEEQKITLQPPVRIANPDSFEKQESTDSESDDSFTSSSENEDDVNLQEKEDDLKEAQNEISDKEIVENKDEQEQLNNQLDENESEEKDNLSGEPEETTKDIKSNSEKDQSETSSIASTTTEESIPESNTQTDENQPFVRPTSTSSPKGGIKKFLRRSLPKKLLRTKTLQSRTDSESSLNNLDVESQSPKSSQLDSGNDLPHLMTPVKQFLRKPGIGQINFTSVDIPVENQLTEVSRKSSLVSLDQLYLGDGKGESAPIQGITRYVGSIYTGDKAFAGTDAAVFLWLTDENGKTMGGKNGYKIREQGGDAFERNTKNRLRINIKENLAALHKLTVRHNGSGLSPDWLLSRIELTEVDEQDRPVRPLQVFGCDEWLKPKRVYELGPDGSSSKYLVKILSEKKLTDENGHFVELYGTKGRTQKRVLKKPELDTTWQIFSIPAYDLGEIEAAALFNDSGNDWIVQRVVVVSPNGEKLVLDFQNSFINPSGLKAFL